MEDLSSLVSTLVLEPKEQGEEVQRVAGPSQEGMAGQVKSLDSVAAYGSGRPLRGTRVREGS